MIDLAIIVEGPTEERFVQRVLAPSLWVRNISAWPVLPGQGEHRRGGAWAWRDVRRDVHRLLAQRQDRYCAIMFDYYGLPQDWPGRKEAAACPPGDRGRVVEAALRSDAIAAFEGLLRAARFLPHIQLHEYEARLFSDCEALSHVTGVSAGLLRQVVDECGSPEQIDDGRETAPSKRLDRLCRSNTNRGYRKTTDGVTAAERMSLETMRACCPHFATWLEAVERLNDTTV